MAKARNKVIAGDYKDGTVRVSFGTVKISCFIKVIEVNHRTVKRIEVVDDKQKRSTSSAITRGLVGGAIGGPAGAIIGGMTAKTKGVYHISIYFKDGKRSLVEVDDNIYNSILKATF